ncbi:hypothetical protein [Pseudonocardia sp. ICBG162]|uniref:hypothetical protein n=1 Tax=Pseudonocardia sp. ICBG162 TaxID=2846761 RepID=UPI001CF71A73|nr:hypothetical protein [Pseudonocardia sp. ICBG162]
MAIMKLWTAAISSSAVLWNLGGLRYRPVSGPRATPSLRDCDGGRGALVGGVGEAGAVEDPRAFSRLGCCQPPSSTAVATGLDDGDLPTAATGCGVIGRPYSSSQVSAEELPAL